MSPELTSLQGWKALPLSTSAYDAGRRPTHSVTSAIAGRFGNHPGGLLQRRSSRLLKVCEMCSHTMHTL
jgi:hypothetical protein